MNTQKTTINGNIEVIKTQDGSIEYLFKRQVVQMFVTSTPNGEQLVEVFDIGGDNSYERVVLQFGDWLHVNELEQIADETVKNRP